MRVRIGGLGVDGLDMEAAARHIVDRALAGNGGRVVTPNVDILRIATGDPELQALVTSADLVLADGMPLVWAARLQRHPLPGRVTGSALGPRLAALAEAHGVGFFLLGGADGTAARAAAVLRERHPGLNVGWYFPPLGFERDDAELAGIDAALAAFGDCVCLVGLGFPKQDVLGRRLCGLFPRSWFIGAGATVAFIAGDVRRAPAWMQVVGLEWVHRLAQEPRRLAGRYARDVPFTLRLLADALRLRFWPPGGLGAP